MNSHDPTQECTGGGRPSPDTTKAPSRRSFLKWLTTLLGGAALWLSGAASAQKIAAVAKAASPGKGKQKAGGKLIFVSIDSLHPDYLELSAGGDGPGADNDWLMPNVRRFVDEALYYPKARCYLPAATDMNHLNALAGTSSAQTGVIGVWAQPTGWDADGRAKRDRPGSKTLMISGKEWVAEMFRQPEGKSGVDILVTGCSRPEYLPPPQRERFADPHTDDDAACDPESARLGIFDWKRRDASTWLTRAYEGQGSMLTVQMEHYPEHFPHDSWIVDSTLEIFRREDPGMAYILLAQCDDAGHCVGAAWDPAEFVPVDPPYVPPEGCASKPEYQLVSKRNRLLYREAALDSMRDVDIQFGRLIDGLRDSGALEGATVVLLSDHSMVNHLFVEDFATTDYMAVLEQAGLAGEDDAYAFTVCSYGFVYWREGKDRAARAKSLLESHRALNPETGADECPWWVLDRQDMKNGVEGVCLPGELYHRYFVEVDREQTMLWPDLVILAKNGWQLPVYNGHVANVGIKAPRWTPPFRVYNGGHGSVDTLPIVAAVSVPGARTGRSDRPIRIGDLGVTAASLFGLELRSSTVGADLSSDLAIKA